jgi:hypothetical protein
MAFNAIMDRSIMAFLKKNDYLKSSKFSKNFNISKISKNSKNQ